MIDNEKRNNVIVELVQDNAIASVRQISNEVNVLKTTVHKIYTHNYCHPYKPTIAQGLQESEYGPHTVNGSYENVYRTHSFLQKYYGQTKLGSLIVMISIGVTHTTVVSKILI